MGQTRKPRFPVLTLPETALYLRVSGSTIRTLIRRKAIPVFKVSNQYRFRLDQLDAWMHRDTKKRCRVLP